MNMNSEGSEPIVVKPIQFGWWRRLPMFMQSEGAECALACVGMVAYCHGHDIDMIALRRRFPLSLGGAGLTWLIERFADLGMRSRPLRCDLDELSNIRLPAVLHFDLNHFVVLRQASRRHVTIHDPGVGVRKITWEQLSNHFSGVVLEVFPTDASARVTDRVPVRLSALLGRLDGIGSSIAKLFMLAFALELISLAAPFLLQTIIDKVLATSNANLLLTLSIGFFSVLVLQTCIASLRAWTVMCTSANFGISWTSRVFSHLMRLPDLYFKNRHTGDIVSRFGVVDVVQQTLTTKVVEKSLDGIMATVTLVALFVYNATLACVVLFVLLIYISVRLSALRVQREANLGQITAAAKQQTFFLEAVRSATVIKLFNQVPLHVARFTNRVVDTVNRGVALQSVDLVFGSINSILLGSLRVGIIYFGARLAMRGQFSAGMLIAFMAYSDQFIGRSTALVDFFVEIKMLKLQGERLADIVLTEPERDTRPATTPSFKGNDGSVACNGISFKYAQNLPWLLYDCHLHVLSGEAVAITGPSGSGKSTLVKVLCGILEPVSGNVDVAGTNIRTMGKIQARKMMSVVLQDDHLLAGSISDNISFFAVECNYTDVEEAARAANLHREILALPMGYDTLITDMGSTLSSGQRQRLCLARALYRKPKILLLDEATNNIDLESEATINDALRQFKITRITISHRTQTIGMADRVLSLEGGRLVDMECRKLALLD